MIKQFNDQMGTKQYLYQNRKCTFNCIIFRSYTENTVSLYYTRILYIKYIFSFLYILYLIIPNLILNIILC